MNSSKRPRPNGTRALSLLAAVLIAASLPLLSLGAASANVAHASGKTPAPIPANPPPNSGAATSSDQAVATVHAAGNPLRIVSFNIWTQSPSGNPIEQRAPRLEALMQTYAPDSMGFQEAQYKWMVELESRTQNGSGFFSSYAMVGVGRNDGTTGPDSGESSPILYNKEKFQIVTDASGHEITGTFWLSETPEVPGSISWNHTYPRVCTYVLLENRETGEQYAHFNTHLDHESQLAREKGARLIVDRIGELLRDYPGVAVIVTGDMNSSQYDRGYLDFINKSDESRPKLWDTLYGAESVLGEGGTMVGEGSDKIAIDHVFYSQECLDAQAYRVLREVPGNSISDHFGLYTEFSLGEPEADLRDIPTHDDTFGKKTFAAAYGVPFLNGEEDVAYRNATPVPIATSGGGKPTNGASGFVKTLFDNRYLYFFAEITDSTVNSDQTASTAGGHNLDGFQVYFDFDNTDTKDDTKASYSYLDASGDPFEGRGHFITYPDDKKLPYCEFGAAALRGDESKLQYRSVKTDAGYCVEARIALTDSLRARLFAGGEDISIGIAYQINDDANDDGRRDYDVYANARTANAWESPIYFDELTLVCALAEEQTLTAAMGSPVIDGEVDKLYYASTPVPVNRPNGKPNDRVSTSDQAVAIIRSAFDDKYIYTIAEVTDATPNDPATAQRPTKNSHLDCVQFMYDFALNDSYDQNIPRSGFIQVNLLEEQCRVWGTATDGATIPGTRFGFSQIADEDWESHILRTDKGYNIELKFPLWSELRDRIQSGEANPEIRCTFVVNDGAYTARKMAGSSSKSDNATWKNAADMTRMTLLTAEDDAVYHITVAPGITGGQIQPDRSTARMGETVTLNILPAEGMQLNAKTLRANGNAVVGNRFPMPGRDVTITAEFEAIPRLPVDDGIYRAAVGTPTLDGWMDAAYGGSQSILADRSAKDDPVEGVAQAEVKTLYDEDFFYFFARVTDPTPNTPDMRPNKNYGVDGVQFFLDFAGNDRYTAGESGYFITDWAASDNLMQNGDPISRAFQGFSNYVRGSHFDYVAIPREGGYDVELKVRLSPALKARVASGEPLIGLRVGIQVNDDQNNDGRRDGDYYSSPALADAWKPDGPSYMQPIYLTGETAVSYYILPDAMEAGTVTADRATAPEGETVTLTVTPASGMRLRPDSLRVNGMPVTGLSFPMPGANAHVTAQFVTAERPPSPSPAPPYFGPKEPEPPKEQPPWSEEAAIQQLQSSNNASVVFRLRQPPIVSNKFLATLMRTGKRASIEILDSSGKLHYRLTFDGTRVKTPMAVDLSLSFETEKRPAIEAISGQPDALYLAFGHHGPLPGPAEIQVSVGDKYRDGERLTLYYYKEATGQIERRQTAVVENGLASVEIDGCSVYFFSNQPVKNAVVPASVNPATGSGDPARVWIGIGGALSLLALTLSIKLRRSSESRRG